ncbi:MAG: TIGR04084 family radical SAM/SPASM domain-containing protein [Promethearchaeota archaeon]
MNYHLVLTRRCNLNCIYCHGGEEIGSATEIQYTIDELAAFLQKDDDVQLMLYGGEPTLRTSIIENLMDRFPKARFMLQTNALLLHKLREEYVKRFHSILVSIDGTEKTTDGYRSKGVYQRVMKSVRWLHDIGFQGDIVARMAVSEQTDIFRDVTHLIDLEKGFDHVHWQLNVIWDAEDNWTDFDKWVEENYKPGITKLVEYWINRLPMGKVEGIVPFLPLMHSIVSGKGSELRCGSGLDTFAIHIDGSIGVCPISPDWEFSIVGNILNSSPSELKNSMRVEEPCPSCGEFHLCGGRCLFANKQRLWGQEGFDKICDLTKHLIKELRSHLPDVKKLVDSGVISPDDLDYPEFNNGCEIIP